MEKKNKSMIIIVLFLVAVLVVSGCTTIYDRGKDFCNSKGYDAFERDILLDGDLLHGCVKIENETITDRIYILETNKGFVIDATKK